MAEDNSKAPESSSFTDPLKELIAESLEVVADTRLDEGILKELPIAGSLLKVYKVFTGLKDQIFFRKLNRFLTELEAIPPDNRAKFWAEFKGSKEKRQRMGEQLIIYLDRHDTIDKAALLARAFGAYINDQIQKVDFMDLAVFIDSVQVHRLEEITSILLLSGTSSFYSEIHVADEWKKYIPELEVRRLLEYEDETKTVKDRYNEPVIKTERKHRITDLGKHFLNFVIPELNAEVSAKIDDFHKTVMEVKRARWAQEAEAIRQNNPEGKNQ